MDRAEQVGLFILRTRAPRGHMREGDVFAVYNVLLTTELLYAGEGKNPRRQAFFIAAVVGI